MKFPLFYFWRKFNKNHFNLESYLSKVSPGKGWKKKNHLFPEYCYFCTRQFVHLHINKNTTFVLIDQLDLTSIPVKENTPSI